MTEPVATDRRAWGELAVLVAVAAVVRIAAAWVLGDGAPFGPDGTGLQASIHLGGHPYPLHTLLLQPFGAVLPLSLASGTATAAMLWAFGRRVGLGGGAGWLAAFLPLAVYPSALSAGDAPALCLVVAGALLATWGRGFAVAGGALAMASVAVKPIALPALVLLAVRPLSFVGVALASPFALRWLGPLVDPKPRGGLLGTWWMSTEGSPPPDVPETVEMLAEGAQALVAAPPWACAWLAALAVLGAAWPRHGTATLTTGTRLAVLGSVAGLWATAALFGERVEPRYLGPSVVALLPWVGAVLPRGLEAALLWPTVALVTQVAAERADRDSTAEPQTALVVPIPEVDARALFDEASTSGATELRARAIRLAEELPQGATIEVERRAHGREGELTWPLAVLRPDVRVEVVDPDARRRSWAGVAGILVLAAVLRGLRALVRWDEVAWLYAAYPTATIEALRAGAWGEALTTFSGLHPPLWPLLHAVSELWAPVPAVWLGGSALASTLAVGALLREDRLAALVLCGSVVQLHYAAEVNQYPVATLWVAAAWGLRGPVRAGRRHWAWLAAAIALAGWTHALAGVAAAAALLGLSWATAGRCLAAAALAALPLAAPVYDLVTDPGSARQPPFELALVVTDLRGRFGLLGLALLAPAAVGATRRPRIALALGLLAATWAALVAARLAAPHQFPYLLFLGPPAALLVGAGATHKALQALVIGVALIQGGTVAWLDLADLRGIRGDPHRAVDVALAELEEPWTCDAGAPATPDCAGDALVLLAPAGTNDDDKWRSSPVLWRLSPFRPLPRVTPHPRAWDDHRYGQPRLVDGHVVYVADQPSDALLAAREAHARLWIAVYEQGQRRPFTAAWTEHVGVPPERVGRDHLYRLERAR